MSKSLGNYVGVSEPPSEMFGKLMSISDELMARYYLLRYASPPPCRFDAVLIEGQVQWIKAAFDAQ